MRFLFVLLFLVLSHMLLLFPAHCQFRRSGDRGNGGLAEAGNSRVVFGELLVLLVSFLRCRAHTYIILARPVFRLMQHQSGLSAVEGLFG